MLDYTIFQGGGGGKNLNLKSETELREPFLTLLSPPLLAIQLLLDSLGNDNNLTHLPHLSTLVDSLLPLSTLISNVISKLSPSSRVLCEKGGLGGQTIVKKKVTKTLESKHPYLPNTDELLELRIPGASTLTISFSSKSKTEEEYDYIKFWKDDKRRVPFLPSKKYVALREGRERREQAKRRGASLGGALLGGASIGNASLGGASPLVYVA